MQWLQVVRLSVGVYIRLSVRDAGGSGVDA